MLATALEEPLNPHDSSFGSFADVFDTLYPQYLQEARESKGRNMTMMQVKQSGHEKVIPSNPDIVFRVVAGGKFEHSSVDLGDGREELSGRAGSFYIAPPDTTAEWRSEGDHELLMLSVPKERVFALLCDGDECPEEDPLRSLYARDIFDGMLSRTIEELWREISSGKAGSGLKFDGLFLTLLGTLSELSESCEAIGEPKSGVKLDQKRLRRVMEYIEEHFAENISVQDLAGVACLSLHHFSRAFASTTNISPYQYVTNRRLTAGKKFLEDEDLSLTEVALMCGFASQSHFTTKFKEHLGLTPGLYRSALKS